MLGQKWTTEYVFRIDDLQVVNVDFRDSTCLVVVGWSRASGGTAHESEACLYEHEINQFHLS